MSNIFGNKTEMPDRAKLSAALGRTFLLWEEIRSAVDKEHGTVIEEWKFYGSKIGWTLKLLLKKRNLFFFSARNGYFILSFVFGDKAVREVEKSGLPEKIKSELKNARKYAEGRGIRIEVKKRSHVGTILKLIAIKVSN
ncbi:MAG: DUF3788 family protein [Ignavibacteriales bacterium]|nr:DUF3788 family protein [Ignavibacteriales bacterium]